MSDAIFISYSHQDLAFVDQLHHNLIQAKLSAWFDQANIPLGEQWREKIVLGIKNCKIFLLILSPNSVISKHVRKELDLAERRNKIIIPVMWKYTDLPYAMEYQLVGVQHFNFDGEASEKNFTRLTDWLHKILAGEVVKTDFPLLGHGQKKESYMQLGGKVIARVVTPLHLDIVTQDRINKDLHWLLESTNHFLHIRQGKAPAAAPVPVKIPSTAAQIPAANNALLYNTDEFRLELMEKRIESLYKQIDIYLYNLTFDLNKEARLGGKITGQYLLINNIRGQRQLIAEKLQELAKIAQKLYGVSLTGPNILVDYFD